ncbi:MAG: NAD-dependent malic enzyme, partial [Patescibacteria group bacterium]
AALLNALRVVGKHLDKAKIVIVGAGAAGCAVALLLLNAGAGDIILVDSRGIVSCGRLDLNAPKRELAEKTNQRKIAGPMKEAVIGADVLIGVSKANLFSLELIKSMTKDPIVFALANPTPEIMPNLARQAGAAIVATGRSDFPNQINNVLGFPGIFRGALNNHVKKITMEMKLAAAKKLAGLVKRPNIKNILPSPFDKRVVKTIAKVIC